MGFFQKLFGGGREKKAAIPKSEELTKLFALEQFMDSLLAGDHYVAKSEYLNRIKESEDLVDWFRVLKTSETLDGYCQKYSESSTRILQIISRYERFPELVDAQNEQYISRQLVAQKKYLDTILKESDPKILLDDDQRRVVLTDEDYCLVIAGAGAGKKPQPWRPKLNTLWRSSRSTPKRFWSYHLPTRR